ncbi:hypothetical protein [Methylobacterium indicum]|uniref:Uncharacterized protein n=1 Tax=Methylobacterium indicum TaxID=1775910 RepID=A0A8H8WZX1_9HYPH|nr:hypothetical protein [Methylobacterium indicum]BCM87292.1 hypothetical protein mvi_57530 [Methylobacterium indicum]
MEKATGGGAEPPSPVRRRGPAQERCALTREVVPSVAVPPGSPFTGCQDVVVRDPVPEACVTRERRECWRTLSGETLVAGVGVPLFQAAGGRPHRNEAGLLQVPDQPEIPLHSNGSENDIRAGVTERRISGGGSRAARRAWPAAPRATRSWA